MNRVYDNSNLVHKRKIRKLPIVRRNHKPIIAPNTYGMVAFRMVGAIVLVRIGSSEHLNFIKTVREELSKVKGVKEVNGVFGRWDFVIKLETRTLGDLGNLVTDCVRSIKGVQSTETLVIG